MLHTCDIVHQSVRSVSIKRQHSELPHNPCPPAAAQVVAELQQRSKQVAYEAAALTSQRQQLAALDAQRRAALRAIEDSLATAGARLDDRAKEEKLKQIRLAEEAYQVVGVLTGGVDKREQAL